MQALFWYKARNALGHEGLVPKTFLEMVSNECKLHVYMTGTFITHSHADTLNAKCPVQGGGDLKHSLLICCARCERILTWKVVFVSAWLPVCLSVSLSIVCLSA